MYDDCISFPSLFVRVRRHDSISVRCALRARTRCRWSSDSGAVAADLRHRYQHLDGSTHEMNTLPRDVSELLQHEIDHLDGVLSLCGKTHRLLLLACCACN